MKILLVDILYDYGDVDRGINSIGQYGFKAAFEELGHEVIPFYYDEYLHQKNILNEKLLSVVDACRPDLIFFTIFGNHFDKLALNQLKKKYVTINWFGDDTWRFDSFTKFYAPHFSYSVTTDKFSLKKYKNLNSQNIIFSQWAAPLRVSTHFEKPNYKYDVSFIGMKNSYRAWFINFLRKQGIEVATFGFGWPEGAVDYSDMFKIFLRSKINLNLSNSTSYDLRYMFSGMRSFVDVIRAKKYSDQIKARNFEICAAHGFQLSQYVPGLNDYYDIGKEIECFARPEEAVELIQYYLSHENLREVISSAGFRRAQNEHGYVHRLKHIINVVSKK